MKSSQDQNKISEVLEKLRKSYLGNEEPKPAKKQKADVGNTDEELEQKLRDALNAASAEPPKKERKKRRSAPKKKASKDVPDAEVAPSPIEESSPLQEPVSDLPVLEDLPDQGSKASLPDEKEPVSVQKDAPIVVEEAPSAKAEALESPAKEAIALQDAPVAVAAEEAPPPTIEEAPKFEEITAPEEEVIRLPEVDDEAEASFARTVEEMLLQETFTNPEDKIIHLTPPEPVVPPQAPTPPSDTIVIRPKVHKTSQEPIVITPKAEKKVEAPTLTDQPISSEPIRIGRRSDEIPPVAEAEASLPLQDTPMEEVLTPATEEADVPLNADEAQNSETAPVQEIPATEDKSREKTLSLHEMLSVRFGLSDDDVSLIFELGYENELGRVIGYENLKKLRHEHLRLKSKSYRKHYRTSFGYRGEECSGPDDRDGLLAAYSYDGKRLLLRTILTAVLTFFALFIDMPGLMGTALTDATAQLPLLLPILGMLLMGASAALSYRQLVAGFRQFFKFEPTPYSVCGILLPLAVIYDVTTMFTSLETLPANFLISLCLLITAGCDILRFSCETRSLRILTSGEDKLVLETTPPRKKKLRQKDKILKIINDDTGEPLYRVRHARETVGFFRRFNDMKSAHRPFSVFILLSFSIAIILAFLQAIISGSFFSAASTFMTTLLICAPMSSIFSYFYPLFYASFLLTKSGSVLLGEEAVSEYNRQKVVIFDDTELFVAKKKAQIHVCEGDDFGKDLQIASLLFSKLGGTLGRLADATGDYPKGTPVSILRIADNGIEALVDGKHSVLAGSSAFLERAGIEVPAESTDQTAGRTSHTALMYVAIDGALKLSYEIEYALNPEFERMATELSYHETTVGIRTYDPNLNDAFLSVLRQETADSIRIIKPGRYEAERPLSLVDTGCVAAKTPEDLASVLYASSRIGSIRRFCGRMQTISCTIGALATILLTLFQKADLLSVLSIALYQGFWMLVSLIATHSELNRSSLHLKK